MLCGLALLLAQTARAEILTFSERLDHGAALPDGYARVVFEARGKSRVGPDGRDYTLDGVLWRPANPRDAGPTLLVETEAEPMTPPSAALADLRQIARRRKMTILFAAPSIEKLPEPLRVAALTELIAHLRKTAKIARTIGRGAGQAAVFIRRAAQPGGADTGARVFDGLLLHDAPTGAAPTLDRDAQCFIESASSGAYWRDDAMAPWSDAAAREDVNRRRFFLAGMAAPSDAPLANCAAPVNARPIEPALRALFAALDDWMTKGVAPPASRFPRLTDHQLTPARDLTWPKLPGLAEAPKSGSLAASIDVDGNETGGLRLPDQAVPIATFTGWNAPRDKSGAPCLDGAFLPFASSKAEREKTGDPRLSLPERYGSRAYYVATVRVVADKLVKQRLLLQEDADAYVAAAKRAPF